ncbi:MAG TPA: nitroreductase family protein [Thermomicrobiales bacterium]|jgi:nitroreductase|nr:nitroreductase family protein [Thermomicrobiales bacterium]
METFEAIRTVLAVRAYADRPVPDDVIGRVVEAARLTASSQNRQPWHFVVVRQRETLRQLAEAVSGNGPYVADAAFAVLVAVDRTPPAVSDAGRAIQSMVLAAWSEGVGSNWVGSNRSLDPVRPILGVPDDVDLVALVPFGYPATPVGQGRKRRKPASETVHGERWGQPYGG